MKELQTKPQVVLNVAGVGSAGMSAEHETEGGISPRSGTSPSSKRHSPRGVADPAGGSSPFALQIPSSPEKQRNGNGFHIDIEASPVGRSAVEELEGPTPTSPA